MSAVWVLALGASLGYIAFQRQLQSDRLEKATAQFQAEDVTASEPKPPGASARDLDAAKRYTAHVETDGINTRLTGEDQAALVAHARATQKEVEDYDSAQGQAPTEGIYLETGLPF